MGKKMDGACAGLTLRKHLFFPSSFPPSLPLSLAHLLVGDFKPVNQLPTSRYICGGTDPRGQAVVDA